MSCPNMDNDHDILMKLTVKVDHVDDKVSKIDKKMDQLVWTVVKWSVGISSVITSIGVMFKKML